MLQLLGLLKGAWQHVGSQWYQVEPQRRMGAVGAAGAKGVRKLQSMRERPQKTFQVRGWVVVVFIGRPSRCRQQCSWKKSLAVSDDEAGLVQRAGSCAHAPVCTPACACASCA
eukprot:scaffold304251_cov14-Tisochrysis_lutea.AAC.1